MTCIHEWLTYLDTETILTDLLSPDGGRSLLPTQSDSPYPAPQRR
jgi:hypothetical protein